mgnify:CR=1 FL=1
MNNKDLKRCKVGEVHDLRREVLQQGPRPQLADLFVAVVLQTVELDAGDFQEGHQGRQRERLLLPMPWAESRP